MPSWRFARRPWIRTRASLEPCIVSLKQIEYGPMSKLLVSPSITPIVFPYIIRYIVPFKEFRLQLIWLSVFHNMIPNYPVVYLLKGDYITFVCNVKTQVTFSVQGGGARPGRESEVEGYGCGCSLPQSFPKA